MRLLGGLIVSAAFLTASAWATFASAEVPMLKPMVEAGKLPKMEDRLPDTPMKLDFSVNGKTIGKYGGKLNVLMGRSKDIGQITVYTYARLVGYNQELELVADILQSYDVKEGREFTFKLRPGHKWSDGKPFTTEDFRYFWEDMVNNPELGRSGIPVAMLVDGEGPKVDIIDPLTIRYTWAKPNPSFLPALAGASPLYIYRPAHYMKQFHAKYGDVEKLNQQALEAGAKDWTGFHTRMQRQRRPENPNLPTLQSFRNTTKPPSQTFVFERNPYFHRVDPEGNQLPYIDQLIMNIATRDVIPAKTGAGESDLQARYLRFDDFTFLKEAESKDKFRASLWSTAKGSEVTLFPNLNTNDPVWRGILRDVRFRRALSLAIDRDEINESIYFGLATPSANTVLEASVLFNEKYRDAWSVRDVDLANQLLDEAGLGTRDDDGIRLLPDGNRAEITIESAGESTEETDVLELVADHLAEVGIKVFVRTSQREVFRRRAYAGDTVMSVFYGMDNALASLTTTPEEMAPTAQAQLQWPKWGQFFETNGKAGEPVDVPEAEKLVEEFRAWSEATSDEERRAAWTNMLDIYTDQVFSIGTVNNSRQPVVVAKNLQNVPENGIYAWSPTAFFGAYRPDTFWFE